MCPKVLLRSVWVGILKRAECANVYDMLWSTTLLERRARTMPRILDQICVTWAPRPVQTQPMCLQLSLEPASNEATCRTNGAAANLMYIVHMWKMHIYFKRLDQHHSKSQIPRYQSNINALLSSSTSYASTHIFFSYLRKALAQSTYVRALSWTSHPWIWNCSESRDLRRMISPSPFVHQPFVKTWMKTRTV